jgi:hypothetical protein
MKKYFMCPEPWKGTSISKKDTGLGNRILHWASVYYLSSFFDDVKVFVQDEYWPELEFLDFPNTSKINISFNQIESDYLEVSSNDFGFLCKNRDFIFKQNQKYYFPKLFDNVCSDVLYDGIKNIKFKDQSVNNFFIKNFSDLCSIHLRRGLGTLPSKGFVIESIHYMGKEKFKNYLKDFFFRTYYIPSEKYTILPDSLYFDIIEKIISKNKDQKIYLCSDIPLKYHEHYLNKYPNNIVVRDDYIKPFLEFFDLDYLESKSNNRKYTIKQTLINLFDLFSLGHSKLTIRDNYSTWTTVSSLVHEKNQSIFPLDYIMNEKQISLTEVKKIYKYYPEYLNKLSMKNFRISDDSSTLLDLIEDWHFLDNEKDDLLNLMDQINRWLPTEMNNDISENIDYINGWNDCLKIIRTKLK